MSEGHISCHRGIQDVRGPYKVLKRHINCHRSIQDVRGAYTLF